MNPAKKLSEHILTSAIQKNASDIHFHPTTNKTDIYFRVFGSRIFYKSIVNEQYQLLLTYYKFTSGMDIGEIRKPQDGVINFYTIHHRYSLRLSTLPSKNKESIAIRILSQNKDLSLDELFLFPKQLEKVKQLINNQAGVIYFTGPTGSGKTTTIYALMQAILKNKSYQIVTLENPIEKEMDNILQVQINEKAGITYQSGLKATLRHDPDIVMIGEVRDKETAEFSLNASLTGHLVLSTLHAKNTLGTIHRLLEMGMVRADLKQALIAIVSLQLVPLEINQEVNRRVAILELLEGELLNKALQGSDPSLFDSYHTFEHLRKKAYAYGFISKKSYKELSK